MVFSMRENSPVTFFPGKHPTAPTLLSSVDLSSSGASRDCSDNVSMSHLTRTYDYIIVGGESMLVRLQRANASKNAGTFHRQLVPQ